MPEQGGKVFALPLEQTQKQTIPSYTVQAYTTPQNIGDIQYFQQKELLCFCIRPPSVQSYFSYLQVCLFGHILIQQFSRWQRFIRQGPDTSDRWVVQAYQASPFPRFAGCIEGVGAGFGTAEVAVCIKHALSYAEKGAACKSEQQQVGDQNARENGDDHTVAPIGDD